MNYSKLQLSFILLLIMGVIHLFTSLLILKKAWLVISSFVIILLCIIGIIFTLGQERQQQIKTKDGVISRKKD